MPASVRQFDHRQRVCFVNVSRASLNTAHFGEPRYASSTLATAGLLAPARINTRTVGSLDGVPSIISA